MTLAKFYAANGMIDKAEEHIRKTESTIEDSLSDNSDFSKYIYIRLAEYNREYGQLEKAERLHTEIRIHS